MHGAALVRMIEDAMAIAYLHLNHIAGDPPKSAGHLCPTELQGGDHPFLVVGIKGDGGGTLTAKAAPGAGIYVLESIIFWVVIHGKKNAGCLSRPK